MSLWTGSVRDLLAASVSSRPTRRRHSVRAGLGGRYVSAPMVAACRNTDGSADDRSALAHRPPISAVSVSS